MKLIFATAIALCLFLSGATAQVTPTFTKYGTGCQSAGRKPITLSQGILPRVGGEFVTLVRDLPANQPFLFIVGESDQSAFGMTLPVDLGFLGAPGCNLYVSEECIGWCDTSGSGDVDIRVFVPPIRALEGVPVYMQLMTQDPTNNAAQVSVSHAAKVVIGS